MGWKEERDKKEQETKRQWNLLNNEERQRDVFNSSLLAELGIRKGMTRLQICQAYAAIYGHNPDDATLSLIMQSL